MRSILPLEAALADVHGGDPGARPTLPSFTFLSRPPPTPTSVWGCDLAYAFTLLRKGHLSQERLARSQPGV